jgi:hypothetical protein
MKATTVDMKRGVYRRIYAGYIFGKRINSVSVGAEAWFWRIMVTCDDFGNRRGNPELVHRDAAGLRAVTLAQSKAWVQELVAARLLVPYEVGGEPYLHVDGFDELQPANKNGKRHEKHPRLQTGSGESGCIQVNPESTRLPNTIPIPNTTTSTTTMPGAAAAGVLSGNAEWLMRRPDWVPEGKPWIDRKTANMLAELRLEPDAVGDVYKRA